MNKKTIILIAVILLATVLRLYKLAENPPSLYWDEASLGYNAYTIANYGIDEHGEYFPVSRFIAFGDYKPPGYIYLDAIIQKVVGLSEFSIRIPSALSGMALVIVIYFLANKILSKKIALLASLGVAFSPGHCTFPERHTKPMLQHYSIVPEYFFFCLASKKNNTIY